MLAGFATSTAVVGMVICAPGLESINALSAVPAALAIMMVGMVVESRPLGMMVGVLSAMYRTTPIAPAFCALVTLIAKAHEPRLISAKSPLSDPDGKALQPNPVESLTGACVMSNKGPVWPLGAGPSPRFPGMV